MRHYAPRNFAEKKDGIASGKITAFLHYLNPQPPEGYAYKGTYNGKEMFTDGNGAYFFPKFVYTAGETIHIREDYIQTTDDQGNHAYLYKADGHGDPMLIWNPPISMPVDAVRFFLEITQTEIVRFSELSKEAAKATGAGGRNPQQQAREMWDKDLYHGQKHMRSEHDPWLQLVYFRCIPRPDDIQADAWKPIKRNHRTYTIRNAATGEIIVHGNHKECADVLGMKDRSFLQIVRRIKAGTDKRFIVEINEPG